MDKHIWIMFQVIQLHPYTYGMVYTRTIAHFSPATFKTITMA